MSTDIKKIITLMLVSIFLVTLLGVNVSAEVFTFDNIKQYDEVTKTVTIVNTFGIGRDISTIQLKSSLNEKVGAGYNKVAEIELDLFDDTYTDAFEKMEFYNKRSDELINRQFDYKYKTIELININDYDYVCDPLNKTGCESILVGTHQEEKEVWKDFDTKTLIKGKVIIGIFTEVQVGDYIEWIPTFFGKEIDEWATWTQSLNVDLYHYYKFDETSGTTAVDSIENANGTLLNGVSFNSTGIIGGCYEFDGTDDIVKINSTNYPNVGSFSLWVFQEETGVTNDNFISSSHEVADQNYFEFKSSVNATSIEYHFATSTDTLHSYSRLPIATWTHIVYTSDGSTIKAYVNSIEVPFTITAGDNSGDWFADLVGANSYGIGGLGRTWAEAIQTWKGLLDEVGFWNRTLSQAEVTQLYNGGDGITFIEILSPTVTLNSPIDFFNTSNAIINFNGIISDNIPLNVSLIIDDVYNETNTSGILGDYLFTKTLPDGTHNWTYESCNSNGCNNATARTLTIDTKPNITLTQPADNTESIISLISFNGTVTTPMTDLINVSLVINGIVNQTNSSGIEGNYTFVQTLGQQVLNWTFEACNPSGCQRVTNRSLEIHITATTIVIIEPTGTEEYILLGNNQTITWNISEPGVNLTEHIVECLYTYNGVTYNVTDVCITTNTTSFPYSNGVNFLNFSVTEEFGIKTNVNSTWNFKLIEINNTFNNETTEGNLETFLAYTQILSGLTVSSVSLIYNNTEYTGESFIVGSNTVFRKTDLLVDDLSTDANLSFYWTVTLSDSTEINLSTQNQTVYILGVDDCSVFTNEILNFTSVDEETQVQLSNVTIETATNIYTSDRSQLILNYSNLSNTNPTRVCLNINLTAVSNYSLDVIVRYENPISANEYYNIVNLELTEDTGRQDITLYDLNISDSTDFQLTFVGSDFLPVENALIYVDRQYISENTFKTVELPKTDYNGQSVLHLVRNDVIYNIRIVKDGEVLGSFENLVAFCDDFTIGDCNIELNAFDSVQNIFDQNTNLGIIFTSPTYNETSNIISFNFLTDDGTAKTVTMNVTRNDIFGNRSICETSLTSSGGTLTCAINPDLDETILITSIYVEGEQVALDQVKLDSSNYGAAGYLILFVFALSLIFMFAPTGKTGILISMVLSVIGATGLGLVSGELIGVGASGIWLLVIVIVGIYKLNKEKQQ